MTAWKEIKTTDEWHDLYETSTEQPVLLFKHSTTCPVSANAFKEFQTYLPNRTSDVAPVVVTVPDHREVSNRIAQDLDVKHESPQAIFIVEKQAAWDASHGNITEDELKTAETKIS